ncbi:MAG: hypothetical protein B7Z53_03415 [Rhodospirillales bacterium 12-71-4]|nr:MAG: hypothetical protein B7Z53_03415 [Rhodospirillales bacterium 12-71-4]
MDQNDGGGDRRSGRRGGLQRQPRRGGDAFCHRASSRRIVIAVADKFPTIGLRFLEAGPNSGVRRLSAFLQAKVDQGVLDIEDTDAAASQFLSLSKDTILAPVLFGAAATIDRVQIETVVARAVTLFMRIYGQR